MPSNPSPAAKFMEYYISIFLGIVSGILIWVISGLLKTFYKMIFLPWLETILYKGIIINGKWDNGETRGNGSTYEMILDIEQSGYNIKGTFFAGSKIDKSDINYYSFNGQIINEYIVANYKVASRSKLGMGAFLLKAGEGGKSLLGTIVFIDEGDMNVATFKNVKFTRI